MQTATKIFLLWLSLIVLGLSLLQFLPNRGLDSTITGLNQAIMLLVGILSYHIYRKELNPKNKPIFFNFTLFFGCSSLLFIHPFVGKTIFPAHTFASFFFYQYVTSGIYFFILAMAIIYLVIDTLFNELKIITKYAITLLIVGSVFTYYYYPILENPKYLYTTEDILDFKAVAAASVQLANQGVTNPTAEDVAAIVHLPAWKDGKEVGILFQAEKVKRVAELLPYLEGSNYLSLLYKPVHLNVIYMNVLCIVFIFLFFGYQYKNDPPQGAYIEKIIFLFLPYCSLEIVHFFGYIMSVEHAAYLDYYRVGQYASLLNLVAFLIFFSLRLRFITSVKGEFYERELVSDSEHISRWRDGLDNLLVRHFLNPQTFHGRLFAPRAPREKT
jgi:hypothetical protein